MGKFDFAAATQAPDTGPQLFCLYGPEGIGKTWFLCDIPGLWIICAEKGLKGIPRPAMHFPRSPSSYGELFEAIDAFEMGNTKSADGKRPYAHLALDSASWIESMAKEEACRMDSAEHMDAKDYKVTWSALEKLWERLFSRIELLRARTGVHVWMTAHGDQRDVAVASTGEIFPKYDLRLDRRSAALLRGRADHVLFLDWAASVKKAKKGTRTVGAYQGRVLQTRETPAWFAKSRSSVPASVPATWADLRKALLSGAPAPTTKLRVQLDAALAKLSPEDRALIEADLRAAGEDARALSTALSRATGMLAAAGDDEPEETGAPLDDAAKGDQAPASGPRAGAPAPAQEPAEDEPEEAGAPLDETAPAAAPVAHAAPARAETKASAVDQKPAAAAPVAHKLDDIESDRLSETYTAIIKAAEEAKTVREARAAADTSGMHDNAFRKVAIAASKRLFEIAATIDELRVAAKEVSTNFPANDPARAELLEAHNARLAALRQGQAA